MNAEFEEWIKQYAGLNFNNEYAFHDVGRESGLTVTGEHMRAAWITGALINSGGNMKNLIWICHRCNVTNYHAGKCSKCGLVTKEAE